MNASCPACGAAVLPAAAYCHQCGQALAAPRLLTEPPVGALASTSPDDAEQVLWEGSYSPKAMLGGWMGAAVLTVVVAAVGGRSDLQRGLFLGLLTAALCFGATGLYAMYRRLSTHYRLTSQRFVHQQGLFRRTTDRIEVIDVDDVAYSQGLLQRMIGVGTVKIMSSDTSHAELYLEGIDRVAHVAQLIDDARRAERRRRGLFIEAV